MGEEQKWIRDIQRRGSRQAADKLVRTYYDEIYRFAYRQLGRKEDAMDLTQSIFLAVLRALPSFDGRKASFRTWLYRIAVNKTIDCRRKARWDSISLEQTEAPDERDFAARIQDRDLLDWKRSCRLSVQAVSALRMAVFGGGSVLVWVPVNLWLWKAMGGKLPLSWMLGVSLSSLFLYGLLSLVCLEGRGRGRLVTPPVLWTALGGLLLMWDGASAWLTALPGAVFLVLAGVALVLYLLELRQFCLGRRRGEAYAFG